MISMVEKITRLGLESCGRQREAMVQELQKNADKFLKGGFVQDFEREWMERYIYEAA